MEAVRYCFPPGFAFIGLVLGTIDGRLSTDDTRMSGSLKLSRFHATGSATQQCTSGAAAACL